jgi:hypothetical protein
MSRRIQDQNFLVWEVFPSGGRLGFSTDPDLVFHCLTQPDLRPRRYRLAGDEAAAERLVRAASDADLLAMLQASAELT